MTGAGTKFYYCVESSAGVRPTSGYTLIPGVKSVPSSINPEPNALDNTTLANEVYKTYEPGLKDIGGSLGFQANTSVELKTVWDALMSAWATAKAAGKSVWFETAIPGFDSLYFTGDPSAFGIDGIEVDSILETTLYIAPTSELTFAAASTKAGGATGATS